MLYYSNCRLLKSTIDGNSAVSDIHAHKMCNHTIRNTATVDGPLLLLGKTRKVITEGAAPFASLSVTEAVDAVASDAACSQNLLCNLGVQSFQRSQCIALDLRLQQHVSLETGLQVFLRGHRCKSDVTLLQIGGVSMPCRGAATC